MVIKHMVTCQSCYIWQFCQTFCFMLVDDPQLEPIFECALSDPSYQLVLSALQEKKNVKNLPPNHPAKLYQNVWEDLSYTHDGNNSLITYQATRIVIPDGYRKTILRALHKGHTGYPKTKVLAQQRYYWPGMLEELKKLISSCSSCLKFSPSQRKQTLISSEAAYPMQKMGADLFMYNGDYLVLVDRYSGFPLVHKMASTTTKAITQQLDAFWSLLGRPEVLRSDNGPCFRSGAAPSSTAAPS